MLKIVAGLIRRAASLELKLKPDMQKYKDYTLIQHQPNPYAKKSPVQLDYKKEDYLPFYLPSEQRDLFGGKQINSIG